ncbi:hypothetical protein WR25_07292 isoform G [Diploscapter pachys]|uniref:RING-type domain-containing protein n=1 Tax=Diploscapter pachys TaxID=2018661 RepID=A0A2A2JWR5_9BILA|nr:hypothetical protein WR25_07292 isoform G [Diploscapter pachys]
MNTSTLVETVNINLEDFSDVFLTCSTCLFTYDQNQRKAKLLPCSHSVCLSCLNQIAALSQSETASLRCPLCRDVCVIPAGGVASFPGAFIINKLLDVMQKQRKDVVPSCAVHPSSELSYCECCDLVFCQSCQASLINKKCTQHTVIPFSIALKRMSEIVVYKAKGRLKALEQAHETVTQEIEQLDQNVDKILEQINTTFQEVSSIVENRRRDIIESVRVRRDDKRKVLKDQIEAITDEKKKLEKELESCQLDVRSMARQLKSMESSWDRQLTQPRENAFLRLNTNSTQLVCDIHRSLAEFGTLSASTTFPGECTISLVEPAATHIDTKFLVKTFDVDGRSRTSGGDPIDVTAKHGNETNSVTVNDLNNGTYEVILRASTPSEYSITVTIFGRPIRNSPFTVKIDDRHPPRWQLPIELLRPTKTHIDTNELFYVLDSGNNRIRIVKENGNLVSDIKSKCLDGQSAVGLSLLAGDELAVLNWKTKAVSRINMKGEVIQSINFSEFKEPIDLAVDNRGRYLIADSDKIFVFDSSLRPQFSFPVKGHRITCVNLGLDDDILVGTNDGLQLFDGAGRFLRSFDLAPNETTQSGARFIVNSVVACPITSKVIVGITNVKLNKAVLAVSYSKLVKVEH